MLQFLFKDYYNVNYTMNNAYCDYTGVQIHSFEDTLRRSPCKDRFADLCWAAQAIMVK